MPSFLHQKVWSRCVLVLGVLLIVWYNSRGGKVKSFAKQNDILLGRSQNLECSDDFKNDLKKYPKCVPDKCGRVVTDQLVTPSETDILLKIATDGLKYGGSDGGASILDLHSGALSKGTGFINIYSLNDASQLFHSHDFHIYKLEIHFI